MFSSSTLRVLCARFLTVAVLTFTLSGCAYYAIYLETGADIYPPTDPNNIEFYVAEPDRPYRAIGAVAVDGTNEESALNKLRNRVTEVGADAVIQMELQHMASFSPRVSVSGVAVKFE